MDLTGKHQYKLPKGLKSFSKQLLIDLTNKIIEPMKDILKKNDINLISEHLENLLEDFNTNKKFYEDELKIFMGDIRTWNNLDVEQQLAFFLHAFSSAIEKNYKEIINNKLKNKIEKDEKYSKEFQERIKGLEIDKGEISFLYRTIIWLYFANKFLFNNGYSNVEKRTISTLIRFLKNVNNTKSKDKLSTEKLAQEQKIDNKLLMKLESSNKNEVLEAIDIIRKNDLKYAIDKLEFLLNNPDPEIMEQAFEAVLELKGENLS